MSKNNLKKLTLISLILMIFTSVFGFTNMPRSFYLMGYGAIPWFIISAITFFIPFAFMLAEYGAAFKDEKGGIYSWMEKSIGGKYAFVATFMWYASYIIWMVNVGSGIWIVISNAVFGKDTTNSWSLFGSFTSTQTLGILAILWIIFVTFVSTKGFDKIKKITSVSGMAVALLNVVLIVGAIAVFIGNHGELAEPITGIKSFVSSPNLAYQTPVAVLAFLVYALFAYGGTEAVGGLVDQTENAAVTFPKGITIAAIIISIGYSLGILLCGVFTNWTDVLSSGNVHLGNVAYVLMNNLGYQLGQAFGAAEATSVSMGNWMARYVGISNGLALAGAFFTLTYSPLKQLIEGTPKELWPKKLSDIEDGMPKRAMRIQCVIVSVIIFLVAFGGDAMSAFFAKLVLMTNVAMTLPYMFISAAFISFKAKSEINKPFVIFKTQGSAKIASIIVTFTVGFANFFTIIDPAIKGDLSSTIWSIAGPVFFTVVALVMYGNYEKKNKNKIKNKAA